MPLTQLQIQEAVDVLVDQFNGWVKEGLDSKKRQQSVEIDGRVFRAVIDPIIDDVLEIWGCRPFSAHGRIEVAETGRMFQHSAFSLSHCGMREFRQFAEAVKSAKTAYAVGIHGFDVSIARDDKQKIGITASASFPDMPPGDSGFYWGRVKALTYEMVSATPVFYLNTSSEISDLCSHDVRVRKRNLAARMINCVALSNIVITDYESGV